MTSSTADRLASFALFAVPLAFGGIALAFGQDSNWDLRNYHWYNPYAFLNGRLAVDLGAAHIATFYNPLLDVPVFLAGQHLPARLMGFLLGLVQGLNFLLLFALARTLISGSRLAAAAIALVGMVGGGHLAMVGATFNDNIVSLAVLAAALILVRRAPDVFAPSAPWLSRQGLGPAVFAGVLIGLAVGLKLPTAPFAVGFCLAFLAVGGTVLRRFAVAFVFGLGVLAGFAISGGPWMVMLWRDYANPLFPYFNGIFRSPMGVADSYRDTRFLPEGILTTLAFPFVFSWNPKAVGEITFRDFRIVTAYAALLITAVIALRTRFGKKRTALGLPAPVRYLITATALTYFVWMLIFGIYRYIIPLEMLAPLVVVMVIAVWPISSRAKMALTVTALVLLTVTMRPGDWEHVPWQDGPFVSTTPPPVSDPAHALALVAGTDPVAWVIPAFPPEIPFLRIQGYLNNPGQDQNGLNDRVRAAIEAHRGTFYVLFPEPERPITETSLAAYGLAADFEDCRPVPSNLRDYVRWCRVYRYVDLPPHPAP